MEYIKLTSIIKGKDDKAEGIVSLLKINGECFLEWSANGINLTDELIFTMQGGKQYQFSNLTKRGKKKTAIPPTEFSCVLMKNGKMYASGQTSKFLPETNDDIIKHVNSFAQTVAPFSNKVKSTEIEQKVDDVFEGKVATYNYYEKELPQKVANNAKAIVKGDKIDVGTDVSSCIDSNDELNNSKSNSFADIDNISNDDKSNNVKSTNTSKISENSDKKSHRDGTVNSNSQVPLKDEESKNIAKPVGDTQNVKPNVGDTQNVKPNVGDTQNAKPVGDTQNAKSKVDTQKTNLNAYDNEDRFVETYDIENSITKAEEAGKRQDNEKNSMLNGEDNELLQREKMQWEERQEEMNEEDMSEEREGNQMNEEVNQWNEDRTTFYDSIKEQLDDLFAKFPQDMYLNEIIPSSKWAKVTYDESGKAYSVGVLTDGEEVLFIGYGVIGEYSAEPPKELNPNAQWVPLNFTKPHGKGYWMLYQSAKDGKNV